MSESLKQNFSPFTKPCLTLSMFSEGLLNWFFNVQRVKNLKLYLLSITAAFNVLHSYVQFVTMKYIYIFFTPNMIYNLKLCECHVVFMWTERSWVENRPVPSLSRPRPGQCQGTALTQYACLANTICTGTISGSFLSTLLRSALCCWYGVLIP